MSAPEFPKRLPEKLKAIREHLGMTPNQLAPFVGAKTDAEILAYENDEEDLLASVLFGYAKMAGIPVENLLYDDRDLWFGTDADKLHELIVLIRGGRKRPKFPFIGNVGPVNPSKPYLPTIRFLCRRTCKDEDILSRCACVVKR